MRRWVAKAAAMQSSARPINKVPRRRSRRLLETLAGVAPLVKQLDLMGMSCPTRRPSIH